MKQLLFILSIFLAVGCTDKSEPVKTDLLSTVPQYVQYEKSADAFCIAAKGKATAVCVSSEDWEGVVRAAGDLVNDIRMVSGAEPQLIKNTSSSTPTILIGTIGKSPLIDQLVSEGKLDVSAVKGQWESFLIQTVDGNLVVAGSDKRGTIYGIYDISEKIGVSPWYWWADVPVRKSESLYVKAGKYIQPSPKVKYRGIFINDEGWGITPWASKTFDKELGDIGPKTYAKVCELILRLKGNMLAPAMHPSSGAFNSIPTINWWRIVLPLS